MEGTAGLGLEAGSSWLRSGDRRLRIRAELLAQEAREMQRQVSGLCVCVWRGGPHGAGPLPGLTLSNRNVHQPRALKAGLMEVPLRTFGFTL